MANFIQIPFTFSLLVTCLQLGVVGRVNHRRGVQGPQPRGSYPVSARKRTDPGARRRRREARDERGWRRSPLGSIDPYVQTVMHAVAPSSSYPARDPRRQSKFLGHLIDGTLGWATDVVHHIPLVGPLVGHPLRLVCRVVRAGENAVNSVTGVAGIHLFIICLLSLPVPSFGFFNSFMAPLAGWNYSIYEPHVTYYFQHYLSWPVANNTLLPSDSTGFKLSPLTNCCNTSQVTYCSEFTCLHDTGCVICQQLGNETLCWEPAGPMVSHTPNYSGVDPWLSSHIDFVAGTIYLCDLSAMHEVCGLAALAANWFVEHLPNPVILNTTANCYLQADSGFAPGLMGFMSWVASEISLATGVVEFLWKVPAAVGYAFGQRHYVTLAAISGLALNGNIPKAVALTVLYVEAAVAAPVSVSFNQTLCNPMQQPQHCSEVLWNQSLSPLCFSPIAAFQPPKLAQLGYDIQKTIAALGQFAGQSPTKKFQAMDITDRYFPGGLGCIYRMGNVYGCCRLKRVPTLCSRCSSDCAWLDRRLRYETCGTTPWLSTACDLQNNTCTPRVVASLALPYPVHQNWKHASTSLKPGVPFVFAYDPWAEGLPPERWARMPGIPQMTRGSWYKVPPGFYSDFRDLSTGLITKDKNHPDLQLAYSASGAFQIAGVTTHIVIMAILAALGARWCLAFYTLLATIPGMYSLSEQFVAATAAADWEDWYVRLLVFLLVFKYPKLCWLLCRRWQFSVLLFLWSLQGGLAFSYEAVAVAAGTSSITLLYFGFFSFLSPFLTLTLSYLRERLQLEVTTWDARVFLLGCLFFPKAVVCVCVSVWIVYALLAITPWALTALVGARDIRTLSRALRSFTWLPRLVCVWCQKLCIWAAAERGVFWFKHLHGSLDLGWENCEPYFPLETEVGYAQDVGNKLACGDALRGLPVHARCGNTVRAGVAALPRGWSLTTPFTLRRRFHRSEIKALAVCLTGRDDIDVNGSVCVMGTPLKTWMGFGFDGKLYTVLHGSNHKMISSHVGHQPPLLTDNAGDVAVYPLPRGFSSLEAGSCDCTTFYLPTKVGRLVTCTASGDRYTPVGPLTLREAKGSSGSPLLCKHKYVKGMLRSVRSARGLVSTLQCVPVVGLQALKEQKKNATSSGLSDIPKVGKNKSIEILVAPTGSGKSTKLPMEYYNQGYKVMVLNPSVATTRSMKAYMAEKYNVTPNILTGDEKALTGSRLTYSTYGMFLAAGSMAHDVIICDECHSTDPTTVLGIGRALMRFEETGQCKLLILATATPPGCPMTAHPNITEHQLTDEGDLDYEGKKIKSELLRQGRHLIFLTSKAKCEALAATLEQLGINAVAYYRGLPVTTIPEAGDVVVCATDALMTGYTGNFDSVYDPCLQVEQILEVDMDPTFSVSIGTKCATSIVRMQRRGRTGRGRKGDYYYTTPHADLSGLVSAATVYECYDSGIAYFGLTPAEIYTALDYFKMQAGLSQITCPLDEVCGIFTTIGHVPPSAVSTMKQRVDSYVLLHAWHWNAALEQKARAPNDDPVWKGLKGSNPFPIICKLQEYKETVLVDRLAYSIQQCYQEYYCVGVTATLAGIGLGVAAVFVAVDLFGNIAVKDVWALTDDTTASKIHTLPMCDPVEEIEECASWDGLARAANEASVYLGDKFSQLGHTLGGKDPILKKIEAAVPHLLAAIQYFAGLACLSEAPGLGTVLGFVGSALSPLPLKVNLFLSALGGAVATRLTTQWGAATFATAGALGAIAGSTSAFSMIMQAFGTYGAATSTCLVVLKLCDGQWPSMSEWSQLAFNILSPGALVAGAGAALMVVFCTRSESQVWMNRLLAMLNKGTACDKYFVEATTLRQSIIAMLENCTLWSIFTQLSNWIHRQDEDLCATPRNCFFSFLSAVGGICRLLVECARGVVRSIANPPGIPYFQCQKGYYGTWTGSGIIRATCGCGAQSTWYVQDGEARPTHVPRRCCSWWSGRVPINNQFWGTARPRPTSWKKMVVNTGFSNCIEYELRGDDVWMTGVTYPGQVVTAEVPDLMAAVAVDGIQIKPFAGTGWQKTGPWRVTVMKGEQREDKELPMKLTVGNAWGAPPKPEPEKSGPTKEELEEYNIQYQLELMDLLDKRMVHPIDQPGSSFESASPVTPQESEDTGSSSDSALLSLNPSAEEFIPMKKLGSSKKPKKERKTPQETKPQPAQPVDDEQPSTSKAPPAKAKAKVKHLALTTPKSADFSFGCDNLAYTPSEESVRVPCVKATVPKGTSPLPDVKPKSGSLPSCASAYALGSCSWETMSESSDILCASLSYVWSVPSLVYKGVTRAVSAISTYTAGIMRYKPLAYTTTYSSVNERVKKVTIQRNRVETPELRAVFKEALRKVKGLGLKELTLDEALAITPNKSAKSQATGLTAKQAKAGATSDIKTIYDGLKEGVASPWNEVCIMPKSEIFIKTPAKPTKKPARIIAYPHLEMRVVEKMVLGEIGPKTVKTVLGEAYGFVAPYERVTKLVRMWQSKSAPAGFVCDTVCFDSTITPDDVAMECELYAAATDDPDTQARIRSLHRDLYQGGPMIMQGALVGRRNCRASGVFTTSSSNTMTCWLKVNAAARRAGIRSPSWLICGDDTVCIFESEDEKTDKRKLCEFAAAMKTMGAPQGEVPIPYYHLEYLESCQANVSACQTKFGTFHYLTRDPRIPLARIATEGKGYNPLGTMIGYIIANYPAVWVSRVIAVHLLSVLLTQDCPERVEFEWYGNTYSVPLDQLPYIIQALHGEQVWSIKQYTPREISRCGVAMREATVRPLRYYKRMARQVWAACRRRRGTLYLLGKTLLSWVHNESFHLDKNKVKKARQFSPFDPYQDPSFDPFTVKNYNWLYVILSAAVFTVVAGLALIGRG
nr:polyprotein [Rodent hepacivirus]